VLTLSESGTTGETLCNSANSYIKSMFFHISKGDPRVINTV
jgi:hypothetical protein